MKKRLFIFAGYDKDGIADATLIRYLMALSQLGDIVFTMDNDMSAVELKKISAIPNVLHATATRHGEYDFGSYKRGYIWARDNKLLSKYEWIYLANDSVVGPIGDLGARVSELESTDADMVGMVEYNGTELLPHIQSWFVGLRRAVATAPFFEEFMNSIKPVSSKKLVVYSYEVRLTQTLLQHGYTCYAYSDAGAALYTKPAQCVAMGIPFVKKLALQEMFRTRNIYSCFNPETLAEIQDYAKRMGIQTTPPVAPYEKIMRITLFSIPIISIYYQAPQYGHSAYKVKLFDCIPLTKIALHKRAA